MIQRFFYIDSDTIPSIINKETTKVWIIQINNRRKKVGESGGTKKDGENKSPKSFRIVA